MAQDGVPVIDIGDFDHGGPAAKDAVKRGFAAALEGVGFLMITGHGVPQPVIDDAIAAAKAFFALPLAEKSKLIVAEQTLNRGYFPSEGEVLSDLNRVPDLKEAFVMGRPDVSAEMRGNAYAGTAYVENLWPEKPAAFRPALEAYYDAMAQQAFRLLRIFAYTLDLPEDFFAADFIRHPSVMRAQNYPAQRTPPKAGQLRAAAHKDYGAFTILREADHTGGLQVRSRAGEWLDIHSPADSFIINVGNVMMRWSNDRWISNLHRVVNPADDRGWDHDRLSIPFFVHPNPDATIACLPSCQSDEKPAKYAPIPAAEHRLQQLLPALPTH